MRDIVLTFRISTDQMPDGGDESELREDAMRILKHADSYALADFWGYEDRETYQRYADAAFKALVPDAARFWLKQANANRVS